MITKSIDVIRLRFSALVLVIFVATPPALFFIVCAKLCYGYWLGIGHADLERGELARRAARATAGEAQSARLARLWKKADLVYINLGPDAATAQLAQTARDMVGQVGGVIQTLSLLPPKRDGSLGRVAAELSFSLPANALGLLLQRLQAARPRVLMDRVEITTDTTVASAHMLSVHASIFALRTPLLGE